MIAITVFSTKYVNYQEAWLPFTKKRWLSQVTKTLVCETGSWALHYTAIQNQKKISTARRGIIHLLLQFRPFLHSMTPKLTPLSQNTVMPISDTLKWEQTDKRFINNVATNPLVLYLPSFPQWSQLLELSYSSHTYLARPVGMLNIEQWTEISKVYSIPFHKDLTASRIFEFGND